MMGAHGIYCTKGTKCNSASGNDAKQIEKGKICTNYKTYAIFKCEISLKIKILSLQI